MDSLEKKTIHQILVSVQQLSHATSLDEQTKILRYLENLVEIPSSVADTVLGDNRIREVLPFLRVTYLKWVYNLEMAAARTVLSQSNIKGVLSYTKAEEYRRRGLLEYYALISMFDVSPRRLLFVGAGPFPSTALLLYHYVKGITIDLVEREEEAVQMALQVFRTLGMSQNIYKVDIRDFKQIGKYEAIIVAGSVGGESVAARQEVLQHIFRYMGPRQILVLRAPYGLEQLLLSPVAPAWFTDKSILYTLLLDGKEDTIYRIILQKIGE